MQNSANTCSLGGPPPPGRARQWLLLLGLSGLVLGASAGAAWWLRGSLERRAHLLPSAEAASGKPGAGANVHRGEAGQLLYQVYCRNCHGPNGHGDGPSAAELKPPPRDFATGPWRYGFTRPAVDKAIREGIPGTGMPAFGAALAPSDLDALVGYVLALVPPSGAPERLPATTVSLLEHAGFHPANPLPSAPEVEFSDTSGHLLTLGGLRGRLVLLVFWGTSCVPCLSELPQLQQLTEAYTSRQLAVVALCADEHDPARVQAVARKSAPRLPLYVDASGLAQLRYQVQLLPTVYLIDPEGRVLGYAHGARDWSAPEIRDLLNACMVREREPTPGL